MKNNIRYHVHRKGGSEAQSPAGNYTVVEEHSARIDDKTLIFIIAETVTGSACCGSGTIRYILVPGWIRDRDIAVDEHGNSLSTLIAINDDTERNKIRDSLSDTYPALQVCFW